MSWLCYELTFRIDTPLHIGYRKTGYIQRTRKYVPGRTFWGAVTAHLARMYFPETEERKDEKVETVYRDVGEWVRKNMIFGYFFIGNYDKDNKTDVSVQTEKIYLPVYHKKNGMRFINYKNIADDNLCSNEDVEKQNCLTETEFENRYLFTTAQTSLRGASRTAEDKSLHEMEFIADTSREQRWEKNRLTGHIFVKKDYEDFPYSRERILGDGGKYKDDLKNLLAHITIGGELAYGNGKISLLECNETENVFDWKFKGNGVCPVVSKGGKKEIYACAHIKIEEDSKKNIEAGDIELFAHREWGTKETDGGIGAGRTIKPTGHCWVPGTRIKKDDKEVSFNVGCFGVWENVKK